MKEEIGKQMKEIIEESEFSVLLTLPGVGVIIASQLIVAYLTHKFSSYRDLQRYAGTTPTYYGSGNKNTTKMRSNCNHYLRGTLHIASLAATNSSKWMKRFYDNKRARQELCSCLRALANTILKIAFAMLRI
ncbi:transposase [Mesotoga sp.]|uniref:transposase n=1 Tax=Mesotoga sp. TaxID=2053577 RepID=UPI00345E55B3